MGGILTGGTMLQYTKIYEIYQKYMTWTCVFYKNWTFSDDLIDDLNGVSKKDWNQIFDE
jgi:hypothetical protein